MRNAHLKYIDSTSGNNGSAGYYTDTSNQPPDAYTGTDRRPGHILQGPLIDTANLERLADGEGAVWLPRDVTDRFVADRLRAVGLDRAADDYEQRCTPADAA